MSHTARTQDLPAGYPDVLAAPQDQLAQVIDGELILTPRPALPHGTSNLAVSVALYGGFHGRSGGPNAPGGWWILQQPELHLGPHIVVPDVAGWRQERLPRVPRTAFLALAPDWVCEVLSPSTARLDRIRKTALYAAAGVNHLWLVDPEQRTLEVFRRTDEHWLLVQGCEEDERVRAEPFAAIELELERWWLPEEEEGVEGEGEGEAQPASAE